MTLDNRSTDSSPNGRYVPPADSGEELDLRLPPWNEDIAMWGRHRAYSWWLEKQLDALLLTLTATYPPDTDSIAWMAPQMVAALRAVRDVHAPRRLDPHVGCAASCPACSTGIVSHSDDGSFTHRVTWPCRVIVAVAEALGIGPNNE